LMKNKNIAWFFAFICIRSEYHFFEISCYYRR
jgi:hypothetical protein